VQVPPARYVNVWLLWCSAPYCMLIICRSSKSDAMDVVNFNEYEGLVTKIYKKRPTKPVVVFVEMPAVEKAFSSKVLR
jgi:hypothetical protein